MELDVAQYPTCEDCKSESRPSVRVRSGYLDVWSFYIRYEASGHFCKRCTAGHLTETYFPRSPTMLVIGDFLNVGDNIRMFFFNWSILPKMCS